LRDHAQQHLVGGNGKWTVTAWNNVVFLKISKNWTPEEGDEYVSYLSGIPRILSDTWHRVFFIFDISDMVFKPEELHLYMRSKWLEILNYEDLSVCLVETKKMRRMLMRSMYTLLGKRSQIKILASPDEALEWVRMELISNKTISKKISGDQPMTETEKIQYTQDYVTRELKKQGAVRIEAIDWEQTPQGRVSRYHRLVISRGDEKSIFKFTEYELLKDYGSKKWENRLQSRIGDILIEFEMSERIGETLVRIGVIKPYQVDGILRAQKDGDLRRFGEIAIEFGYINDEMLKKYVEAKAVWEKEA
jgi:hypothetical protein